MKKHKIIIITAVFLLVLVYTVSGLSNKLEINYYSIESEILDNEVRIALLTDFHSSDYGDKSEEIKSALDAENPDLVFLCGDIFDDKRDNEETYYLLEYLCQRYKCYYVTGNHEYWAGEEKFNEMMNYLSSCGIKRLSSSNEKITINGQNLNICGVDDPANQLFGIENDSQYELYHQIDNVAKTTTSSYFDILLTHRPEYFSHYKGNDFNLILTGHTHGGQIRIPPFINGLYAPGQGLFPEYSGGIYTEDNDTMIVSRGLARNTEKIPRFFNNTEIVIISLKGK